MGKKRHMPRADICYGVKFDDLHFIFDYRDCSFYVSLKYILIFFGIRL
jgi:hypothetical protein